MISKVITNCKAAVDSVRYYGKKADLTRRTELMAKILTIIMDDLTTGRLTVSYPTPGLFSSMTLTDHN